MVTIRCDRCGDDVDANESAQTVRASAPQIFGARTPKTNRLRGKTGSFQFEVVNTQFISKSGEVTKVDLCRACIATVSRA